MHRDIDSLDDDRLLNTNPEDLADYFYDTYRVDPPALQSDYISVETGDAKIDVSQRLDYGVFPPIGPAYVDGIYFRFHIPFTGTRILFDYLPRRFTSSVPMATVRESEVIVEFHGTDAASDKFKESFDAVHLSIQRYLGWVCEEAQEFNESLKGNARGHIDQRRQRLIRARKLGESFGFKLRKRDDAPETYSVPVKRRVLSMPSPGDTLWMPDPTLELEEYNNILAIITNMAQVMERSPSAFRNLSEENLRDHFLVQLNGQYQGSATGETFNYQGKTDILIRHEGKNIFVAECKFWGGQAALVEAIDQLLGYTTWRDTKTALLVFNKDRQLTTVLKAIEQSVPEHSSFKRNDDYAGETAFRYILGHPDDPDREIILTILVFEVPR